MEKDATNVDSTPKENNLGPEAVPENVAKLEPKHVSTTMTPRVRNKELWTEKDVAGDKEISKDDEFDAPAPSLGLMLHGNGYVIHPPHHHHKLLA